MVSLRRSAILLVLAAACGRIGFDPSSSDGGIDTPPPDPLCTPALVDSDALGAGTEQDPHLLCTQAQLLDLMQTAAVWNRHYRLGADIDLAGASVTPIGTLATPFTGVFDGQGHAIANFKFKDILVDGVGLFGKVDGIRAEIRDLQLTDVRVEGRQYVGALVGFLGGGAMVTDCSSTGSIHADESYVGGLVGLAGGEWVLPSRGIAVISTSWSSATVDNAGSNTAFAGGLVGVLGGESICINSYATGDVTVGLDFAGGLAGGSTGYIVSSYATGDVDCWGSCGGVVGSSGGEIVNSFATGNVLGMEPMLTGKLVGDDWGSVFNSVSSTTASCTLRAAGTCHASVPGESSAAGFSDPASPPLAAWNFAAAWVDGNGLPTLAPKRVDLATWGTCAGHLSDAPYAGGFGTVEAPFLICTQAQLAAIAADSLGWVKWRAYRLMDHLTLTAPSTPIGSDALWFYGFFDGNGKTITGLQKNAGTDLGLFGAANARIVRLGLINGTITGSDRVGLIAGSIHGGGISDSYATGSVGGMQSSGGLVGELKGGGVWSSYFVGTVNGLNGGGLLGDWITDAQLAATFVSASVTVTTDGGRISSSTAPVPADNYYDASKICLGCTNMLGTPRAATTAFYDPALAPLSLWDFTSIWRSNAGGFPTLR